MPVLVLSCCQGNNHEMLFGQKVAVKFFTTCLKNSFEKLNILTIAPAHYGKKAENSCKTNNHQ